MSYRYFAFSMLLVFAGASLLCAPKKNNKSDYLSSPAFKQRLVEAAKWVADVPTIIEVGGGKNPLDAYVQQSKLVVIDPEIKRKEDDERIIHVGKGFEQAWEKEIAFDDQRFAVVIMGLELKMPDHGWNKLYDYIERSEKTVIEWSVQYSLAKTLLKTILKNTTKQITQEKEFDFSQENWADLPEAYPLRKMICLESKKN